MNHPFLNELLTAFNINLDVHHGRAEVSGSSPDGSLADEPEPEEEEPLSIDKSQYSHDDIKFIEDNNLICSICQNVIRATVAVTPCLHYFCDWCIFKHIDSSDQQGQVSRCPNCKTEISHDSIFFHEPLTKKLDACMIICSHHNPEAEKLNLETCQKQVPRKLYTSHVENCLYRPIECPDCKKSFYNKDESLHALECSERKIKCEKCSVIILYKNLHAHIEKECSHTNIKCMYDGCNFCTKRRDMITHYQTCEFRMVMCRNKCNQAIQYRDQLAHDLTCHKRREKCPHCSSSMPFDMLNSHFSICCRIQETCNGCQCQFSKEVMRQHECPRQLIECQDCKIQIERQNLATHFSRECIYRMVPCQHCQEPIALFKHSAHRLICPEENIKCRYCFEYYRQKNDEPHKNSCPNMKVDCKYSYAGCYHQFPRKDTQQHMDVNKDYHLDLLHEFIMNLKD